jgi:zinc and cadmium transporter
MILWIFGSVLLVSLIGALAIIPVLFHADNRRVLTALLSFAAGSLIAAVIIHFIPEIVRTGYYLSTALTIIGGFLAFFLVEKLVHYHHSGNGKCREEHAHHIDAEHAEAHGHAYHLAPMNLIGDAVHNFLDGIVIAASYLVSIPLGITSTIAVIAHEIPQEIADYGVLFYSGMSKVRALIFNVLSALTAVLGAIVGILGGTALAVWAIPAAAGGFLYIGSATLVPQLHRHCGLRDSVEHVVAFLFGVSVIVLVTLFVPHVH